MNKHNEILGYVRLFGQTDNILYWIPAAAPLESRGSVFEEKGQKIALPSIENTQSFKYLSKS